jgi:predicted permease
MAKRSRLVVRRNVKSLTQVGRQLKLLFDQSRFHRDLSQDMREHLEEKVEELVASGMPENEARYQARREFGNAVLLREQSCDVWGFRWFESLLQDLRYGLRQLGRNPGFTAVAVITLALGIGANTAIFSIVNAALLHPLPFQDADRLVTRWGSMPEFSYTGPIAICGRDYSVWRDQNRVFGGIAAFSGQTSNLTGAGEPIRLEGSQVTAGFFELFGITPALGSPFRPGEDSPGTDHEVLLSDKLWRNRFGSDVYIVGRPVTLDGELYTVAGVMPAGFDFPNQSAFWTPVPLTQDCSNATMQLVARLKPGVTLDQARSEIVLIDARLEGKHHGGHGIQSTLVPLTQAMGYDLCPELTILLGAVGFLLLIACASVANLLLARGATRQHEMAVRSALGAGRLRIAGQVLTESVLLAAVGGALALPVGACAHRLLASAFVLSQNNLFSASLAARIASLGIDRWALGFTLAVTCLTGIMFGLAPAFRVSKPDLTEALKECGRNLSARRGHVRDVFVVAEIAISLVLLVGAGLLVRTLADLTSIHPGFSPGHVLSMAVDLPETRYRNKNQMIEFEQKALQRLRGLPGVLSVGGVFGLPFGAEHVYGDITIQGLTSTQHGLIVAKVVVAGDYFRTLGIPLSQGRFFGRDDTQGASRVAVVSQELARRLWPHESAIGNRLKPGFAHDSWYRVVGVVGNVKMESLGEESPPALYLPYEQAPATFMMEDVTLVLRTSLRPLSIAAAAAHAINSVDPELPVFDVTPMDQLVSKSVSEPRFDAMLLAIFAALALILAGVGIYGVMSYAVAQHTHEIGIRMALGARSFGVLRMVLGEGLRLALIGLATGLAGAVLLSRLLSTLLYGVRPTDPLTFVTVSSILAGVALLACYIPARRATKVDPLVALRHE